MADDTKTDDKAPAAAKKDAPAAKSNTSVAPSEDQKGSGAPKITVETTGDFMLIDPMTREEISHEGSTEVTHTSFIDNKIKEGQLKEV